MRAKNVKWIVTFIAVALATAGLPLFGQVETSTGVARVSLIQGDVSTERGDANEWVQATMNTPLVPGDTIATAAHSRAEVQLDYANVLRLDENAEVKIADLSGSRIQLQVARGTVDLAVMQGNQTNSELDTPNVAVQPLQPGTYRIDVNSNDLSLVTVRDGQAQVSTPQGSTNVEAGNQITIQGAQNPQYQIASAAPRDGWDQWNSDRNRVIDRAANYNHVNRYYTGAQDLDSSGHWVYVPNYDWCWTPYVNAGWVPYSDGRWVWEPYYGWTWVSYDPWGWAPYHYGRWFFYGSSWCWWPGAVTPFYRPLWAPAYVSFIGFGYGYHRFSFGFGYGFDSIGWCPLGPRDRFDPWWGRGRDRSFNVVNITNVTNINNFGGRGGRGFAGSNLAVAMTNMHVRRAITTMPADRFGHEAVFRNRQPVSADMLRHAGVVRGTLPVVPTRGSLSASNRRAVVPSVARNTNNVRFFTRHPVTSPNGTRSFNSQAASVRQMIETHKPQTAAVNTAVPREGANRTFGVQGSNGASRNAGVFTASRPQASREAANIPATRAVTGARPTPPAAQAQQQGWRRFGAPSSQAATSARGVQQRNATASVNPQTARNESSPAAGWHRFGNNAAPAGSGSRSVTSHQGTANVSRDRPQPRNDTAPRQAPNTRSNQPGWHNFSGNAPAASRQSPGQAQRSGSQRFSGTAPSSGRVPDNRSGNFHPFTRQPAPANGGRTSNFLRAGPESGNGGRASWTRFTPRSEAAPQNRGGGFYNEASREGGNYSRRYESFPNRPSQSYSRPPLRLNKPIVTERRSRSYGEPRGGSGPSYHSSPRSSPSYSSHGYGGSRSSPSSYSSRGSGGGHYRR
jgi:Family of unknown function (DUF6600)/FecR protein